MIANTRWAGVALVAALAAVAGPALAGPAGGHAAVRSSTAAGHASPPAPHRASRAASHAASHGARGAAAAVHTATSAPHRLAHHRRRHVAPPVLTANPLPPAQAPGAPPERSSPTRQRPHRATLPAVAHVARHAPHSKYGPRHAPAALTRVAAGTLYARALETRRDAMPDPRILTVSGGRGPPRGSPAGPSRGRAAQAPAPADDPDPSPDAAFPFVLPDPQTPDGAAMRAPDPGPGPLFPDVPEAGSCRLHAARPEGATACYLMPSNGGTPCPASSLSPR